MTDGISPYVVLVLLTATVASYVYAERHMEDPSLVRVLAILFAPGALNATIGGLRGPKREARGRDDMDDGGGGD
jgi:hypothetical protein